MSIIEKLPDYIPKIIKWIYTIMMSFIILLCFFGGNIDYFVKKAFTYDNKFYMLLGVFILVCTGIILNKLASVLESSSQINKSKHIMIILNIIFGIILFFTTYHYYFSNGWDAGFIVEEAQKIAHGEYQNLQHYYFSRCSNNVFITVLFSFVIRFGELIGIGNAYYYLVAFQCGIYAYSGFLTFCIADILCKKKQNAVLAWGLYIILVECSPWVAVPYTDVTAIFFLVTIMYLYCTGRHKFLLGGMLIMGGYIKPQIIIVAIAIVIVYGLESIKNIRQTVKELLPIIYGILVGFIIIKGCVAVSHIEVNSQKELGIPHYLMLGLNEERSGVFIEKDLIFSESFSTKKERNAANLQEAGKRIQEMGAKGFGQHIIKKIMTIYDDGSFAWKTEGSFIVEKFYSGNSKIREFFWSIYFPDGEHYSQFLNVMQTIWLGVLFFTGGALLGKQKDKKLLVCGLTIIGLTLFELLFEPRARHLFIFIPIYVILASSSWEIISDKIQTLRVKKNDNC